MTTPTQAQEAELRALHSHFRSMIKGTEPWDQSVYDKLVKQLIEHAPALLATTRPSAGDAVRRASLNTETISDAETIKTLLDLLNPLHGDLDKQLYDERMHEELDIPKDREYSVTVTEQQERDLTQAVLILENRRRALALSPDPAGQEGEARDLHEERMDCYQFGKVDPAHLRGLAVTHEGHVHTAAELNRAADEIDSLRAERTRKDALDQQTFVRMADLEAALAPFAKIAADYEASDAKSAEHHRDEGRPFTPRPDGHRVSIAIGDCRRARAALKAKEPAQ